MTKPPHYIVCGFDELAYRCAEELVNLGERVVVVALAPEGKYQHRLERLGATIVTGNYRDDDALAEAGIKEAAAIIVAENDDAGNLHAALAARELHPEVRVVLRLFNVNLAKRMADVLADAMILSSSGIAAPAFVAAVLQNDFEESVEVDGRTLILRHATPGDEAALVPVARVHRDGSIDFFPALEEGVLCLAEDRPATAPRVIRRTFRRFPDELRGAWTLLRTIADRRLRYVLGAVAALVLLSTVVLAGTGQMSALDALYFTITTITTIGYGDITLRFSPLWIRIFGMLLELIGAGALAVFFAVITDALVGVRLRQALGTLHRSLDDHVVVAGLGNLGHRVAELLHARDLPVIAMESNEAAKAIAEVRRFGVAVVVGDARESANLRNLGIESARCLVVCTDDDATNLEIALTARTLHPDLKVVIQLHDPDLAARVQRAIGTGVSRSTASVAAPAFVSAAIGHDIVSTLPVGERTLVIARATVKEGAQANGRHLGWLVDGPYARILKVEQDGVAEWMPNPERPVTAGDELVVVATRKGLDGVLARTEPTPRAAATSA
ncbi:MAG TPA: NAD-binding protein [Candidatus Dormibacteraeota bacterium]